MSKIYGLFSVHKNSVDQCIDLVKEDIEEMKRMEEAGNACKLYIRVLEEVVRPHLLKAKESDKSMELILEYNERGLVSTVVRMFDTDLPQKLFDNYFISALPREQLLKHIRDPVTRKQI